MRVWRYGAFILVGIGYSLKTLGIQRLSASSCMAYTALQPVLTCALAAVRAQKGRNRTASHRGPFCPMPIKETMKSPGRSGFRPQVFLGESLTMAALAGTIAVTESARAPSCYSSS